MARSSGREMSAPQAEIPESPRAYKTTRLQEIALEYVERYWDRVHPEDRLALLLTRLTAQERRKLVQRVREPTTGSSADNVV